MPLGKAVPPLPRFPHLSSGDKITNFPEFLWETHDTVYEEAEGIAPATKEGPVTGGGCCAVREEAEPAAEWII